MEIQRYVNGIAVSENELSSLSMVTRELNDAIVEARRRVGATKEVKDNESERHE